MKMPKTVQEFEEAMLLAFKDGLVAGYGIDHEHIREDELKAAIDFCERHHFRYYGKIYYPPMFDYAKEEFEKDKDGRSKFVDEKEKSTKHTINVTRLNKSGIYACFYKLDESSKRDLNDPDAIGMCIIRPIDNKIEYCPIYKYNSVDSYYVSGQPEFLIGSMDHVWSRHNEIIEKEDYKGYELVENTSLSK